jgi:hypothetical protein
MRPIVALALAAALTAACGGSQPPAVPASPAGTPPPAEPARGIPAPAAADLHGAPAPDAEDLRELFDISRDLLAVAAGESGAVPDLAQDLSRFAPVGGGGPDVSALAERVGAALKGRTLDVAGSQRLAVLLYVTMHAAELTPAQRTAAATGWREALAATGASGAAVDAVADSVR